jgi:uncharacterized membrane protein YccC
MSTSGNSSKDALDTYKERGKRSLPTHPADPVQPPERDARLDDALAQARRRRLLERQAEENLRLRQVVRHLRFAAVTPISHIHSKEEED